MKTRVLIQKWNALNTRKQFFFVSGLLFIAFLFIHMYKLGQIPYGYHIDEAGAAYDAYCLANFGVDRYLIEFPSYLINFGGGQSILYAYCCIPFIKIFGLSLLIARLPAFIFSIITYLSITYISKCIVGEKGSLVMQCLLVILPYFTMQSRFGMDCNLLLPMISGSIAVFICACKRKKTIWYLLTGVLFGITLYTYALSYLMLPVFLILIMGYLLYLKEIKIGDIVAIGLPLGLLATPLILTIIVNQFDLESIKIAWFTIPRIPGYRNGDFVFSNIYINFIQFFKYILYKDEIDYNAFNNFGTIYRMSIPFFFIGLFRCVFDLYKSVNDKKYNGTVMILACFFSELIIGCFIGVDGPNINTVNGVFLAVIFMIVYGIVGCYVFVKSITVGTDTNSCAGLSKTIASCKKMPHTFIAVLIITYSFLFFNFAQYYFTKYEKDFYPQYLFQTTYEDAFEKLGDSIYEHNVYIDASYIYFLCTTKVSPYDFDIATNGTSSWRNFFFELTDNIDINGIYIIRDTNTGYCNLLEENGFDKFVSGMYVVYYRAEL